MVEGTAGKLLYCVNLTDVTCSFWFTLYFHTIVQHFREAQQITDKTYEKVIWNINLKLHLTSEMFPSWNRQYINNINETMTDTNVYTARGPKIILYMSMGQHTSTWYQDNKYFHLSEILGCVCAQEADRI